MWLNSTDFTLLPKSPPGYDWGDYSCYAFSMNKYIAPHVTAILTGAGAVLSVVHPGFKIPVGVEGLIASLCLLASTLTEALHFVKKSTLQNNIAVATHLATQITGNVKADTAPVAPATPA